MSLLVIAVVLGMVGVDRPARTAAVAPAPGPPPVASAQEATGAVEDYARNLDNTDLGVAVLDRRTGQFAGNDRADEQFNSASVVKPIVAIDILQRRAQGMPVSEADLELIRSALKTSDDEAMNDLWDRMDGPGAVTRVAQQLRLQDTRPPRDPIWWGDTQVSARDMVAVFQHVLTGMPARDREFIVSALREAPPVGDGGFEQSYGLAWDGAEQPAVKQGWMCCRDGYVTLHSTGVLRADHRYVVALLSTQPGHAGYEEAKAVLTRAAQTLTAELP
ncbi:hypothetical protein GIY23_06710 [Allosaccharopolyspora coralli]|uniref:Beta-lactamase class A catalytic domain-containing protein n=1 Tax=Allosaccharopolyspora coralli TaxID=2665642 RepID=A0A5Q3QEN4_9PSEU|nr:serine hydrolase [Allosaccharopolyspora coralli]QGK69267.1 hypothetical protein GIY23_06710 [Allosaccharopolyspora coralli]